MIMAIINHLFLVLQRRPWLKSTNSVESGHLRAVEALDSRHSSWAILTFKKSQLAAQTQWASAFVGYILKWKRNESGC
jgi:hypothetical protein